MLSRVVTYPKMPVNLKGVREISWN